MLDLHPNGSMSIGYHILGFADTAIRDACLADYGLSIHWYAPTAAITALSSLALSHEVLNTTSTLAEYVILAVRSDYKISPHAQSISAVAGIASLSIFVHLPSSETWANRQHPGR